MKVHELKSLNFSEALSLLDEKVISAKGDLENVKSRTERNEEARVIAAELQQKQLLAEEKMSRLREEQSFELSGRNDTIMKEIIDALDSISEGIQKMLRLL